MLFPKSADSLITTITDLESDRIQVQTIRTIESNDWPIIIIQFMYNSIFQTDTDSMEIGIICMIRNNAQFDQDKCYKQLDDKCHENMELECMKCGSESLHQT